MNQLIKTSKGEFELAKVGGGNGYEVNKINDCARGYFILLEDDTRDYFTSLQDELIIREAYENQA